MSAGGTSIWKCLGHNRAVNAPVFRAAHIEVEDIVPLRCPSCKLDESALFWSPVERTETVLRLSCPVCGRAGARYNLRRNRGRAPADVRRIVATSLMVVGVLTLMAGSLPRHAPPPDQVRFILHRTWQQAESVPGKAREWVENAVSQTRSTLSVR
jgi:hypothetical protein